MDEAQLHALVSDRELRSPELHQPNDFYGHASCLKRFAGLDEAKSLHAVVVHGPMFPTLHWSVDLQARLPVLLTSSGAACRALRNQTDKLVFSIGPMLAYASCHFTDAELAKEKERLGRNLLVFPTHSTHTIDAMYDAQVMCADIERMGREYDSVTVCLYWKDALRGMDAPFRAAGFGCYTAGHMFDLKFLDRLRTWLTLSDAVVCYSWTSAIGYAVLMNKPTLALHAPQERFVAPEEIIRRDSLDEANQADNVRYRERVFRLFAEMREPTPEQREAIDYMWGLSQIRPHGELVEMLHLAEDMYETADALRLSAFPDAVGMARVYARMGRAERALLVLEQALQMGRQSADMLHLAARLRLEQGDVAAALVHAKALLREYPERRTQCTTLLQEAARKGACCRRAL